MHSEENAVNHRCYGYNAFRSKKYCSEIVWYFIGVHILNRSSHGRSEIIGSLFSHGEILFRICERPCNILYIRH